MHGTALSMAGMTDTDLFVVSLPLSLQGHSIKAKEKLFLTLFVLTVVDFDSLTDRTKHVLKIMFFKTGECVCSNNANKDVQIK